MKMHALAWTLFVCAVAACGSDDAAPTPQEDACEHMAEGPFEAVTAAADNQSTTPSIDALHTRYDITLAASGADYIGFVELVNDEMAERYLFLDADVPIELSTGGGAVAPEESFSQVADCGEVATGQLFDLDVATYQLEIGPTSQTSVSIVIVEPADGHGHDHGHDHE